MKTIAVLECKTCFGEYFADSKTVTLEPNDQLEFVTKKVARCPECKRREDRTIAGKRKRFTR